ncbi:heavy-metal-associated domain-containing protein [Lysobacter humi (ex Lee et al. 2017)]
MKFDVEGMTCSHCERAITRAVGLLGGTARVDVAAGTVEVEGLADESQVRAAIEGEGYRVVGASGAEVASHSGCCGSCAT